MEMSENTKEGEPKISLKQLLIEKAERKNGMVFEGGESGYSPQDVKNVRQNYRVVKKYLERLPDENFESMTEIISNLNILAKDETRFPNVNDEIDVNGRYRILAVYPPEAEVDALDAIAETPDATTFISGTNFWDNPFSPKQVFLPGNYILKDA